jgi:hypothetical protein
MGPPALKGPELWSEEAERITVVATFAILLAEVFITSVTLVSPARVPDAEMVKITVGEEGRFPGGSVEKVKLPMPEAPGASVPRDGSVSRLKTTVWSAER